MNIDKKAIKVVITNMILINKIMMKLLQQLEKDFLNDKKS